MQRDYKFFLALENSLCLDYVTEKFFWTIDFDVVPVVFDLHGNYKRLAPPKSYINALDFASVKDFADYLKLLDTNDDLYGEYFAWRDSFVVRSGRHDPAPVYLGLCHLCALLHEPYRPPSVYGNVDRWWHKGSNCKVIDFLSEKDDPTGSYIWKASDYKID